MAKRNEVPDLRLVEEVVAPRILQAARETSNWMTQHGVRHCVCGVLAFGCYGYARATDFVEFLVGEEAFEHRDGNTSNIPGFPIKACGVRIVARADPLLEELLSNPPASEVLPIAPVEGAVYLKVRDHRRRDQEDVRQLLRAGVSDKPIRAFLQRVAPELVEQFAALVAEAEQEE